MAARALAVGLVLLALGGCSVAGSVSFGDFFLGYGGFGWHGLVRAGHHFGHHVGFSGHHVGIAIR
jgi:hypothetical protein